MLFGNSVDASIRDLSNALIHGEISCKLTAWADVVCLKALASANAAKGDYDEAIRLQTKAVVLASSDDYEHVNSTLAAYKKSYRIRDDH